VALSLGVKWPGREADNSPPSSALVNVWSYTSTPQYAFMAWCLVNHRDNFTFTFLPYTEDGFISRNASDIQINYKNFIVFYWTPVKTDLNLYFTHPRITLTTCA
jgi:hypothetical protein